jgi:16S rRNA (cytidine1402-2'-O)-methyltransferase
MPSRQAVIALGSNLGSSEDTLVAAAQSIAATPGIEPQALSSIYTSKPAIVTKQPNFKNAVMLVETTLSPQELLHVLLAIEKGFGRVRSGEDYVPCGPRTLDLDLIDFEGMVLNTPQLVLPHPQALRRAFVVTPLLEISPCHVLANHKVVNDSAVDCGEIVEDVSTGADGDEARSAAALAADEAEGGAKPAAFGRLSLCATPIGNLGDITLRVLDTLRTADVIYCEDTRVTRKLASRYDITAPLRRGDSHRLPTLLPSILAKLAEGAQLAYVSDAGMPAISDPGALLVSAVRSAGYAVEILPGASALTTAVAASGLKARAHYFGGFFPRKHGDGTRLLSSLEQLEDTVLVFYESVHRTEKTLRLVAEVLPSRQVVLARELTKLHEEVLTGTARELASLIAQRSAAGRPLKGEVVLMIAPAGA